MLQHIPRDECRCARCCGPLIELLSDAAGRIFGCLRCGTVDPANAQPPAVVMGIDTLTRRARRSRARQLVHGRRGTRRVARTVEWTHERDDKYMVLRAEMFEGRGAVRVLAVGWALGIFVTPHRDAFQFARYPKTPRAFDPRFDLARLNVVTETVYLKRVGGATWGYCDSRAPDSIVLPAFERLWHERVATVFDAFSRMVA